MRILFASLLLLSSCSQLPNHAALPSNTLSSSIDSEWDNGYPESRYNLVLDTFQRVIGPKVAATGAQFTIERDWSDGSVNCFSWKNSVEFGIEIPGGMARYDFITEEAFIMVICHEIGHVLGGAPHNNMTSIEGQSDYFSALKCARWMMPEIVPAAPAPNQPVPDYQEAVNNACERAYPEGAGRDICLRSVTGAHPLSRLYAKVSGGPTQPSILTPTAPELDVRTTLSTHPKPQCRLDSLVRGSLCPVSVDSTVSYSDPYAGSCGPQLSPEFGRPGCWFAQ